MSLPEGLSDLALALDVRLRMLLCYWGAARTLDDPATVTSRCKAAAKRSVDLCWLPTAYWYQKFGNRGFEADGGALGQIQLVLWARILMVSPS